ncbi:MAG: phospholipase a2 [Ilumatobacteraceae bacterium]|nr:phospholipase a2 [Ilumatobacteraceae bacterium]
MRHLARVLVAVTSLLTAMFIPAGLITPGWSTPTFAAGGGTAAGDDAFVQRMLFATSIGAFTSATRQRIGPDGRSGDTWFDWSTDLCSAPLVGNTGRSFDFTEPCRRHDFGYRNTKLLDRRYGAGRFWNGPNRKRIDENFLGDMLTHCHARRLIDRPTCISWAYTYYSAVRLAGGP